MAFNDRLKEARVARGLTQEQLALQIGVAKSTVTGYEKGNSEPNMLTVQKIMQALNIDANFLWQDEMLHTTQLVITLDEKEHIKKYRALDRHGKKAIDQLLDIEYTRLVEQSLQVEEAPASYLYTKTEYLTGLSAGTGLFVFDDIPTQVINVPEMYKDADFVIGVSGDSMQPTYYDGDKVAVKKCPCIDKGEIGVFMIDGNGYIKELGDGKLISHNKKFEDIELTDSTVCIGKVLGRL